MDVTNKSTFKWALAALFAAMLTFVLTPAGAWAVAAGDTGGGDNQSATETALTAGIAALEAQDDPAPVTTATVDFTSQMEGRFLHVPQFGVEVASNEAENFGYTDEVDGVSALDVLVKAHEEIFGSDFTAANAKSYLYLKDSDYGPYITAVFGEETSNFSFAVDGEAPADKTQTVETPGLPDSYLGLGITQAPVEDGSFVEFFVYQSDDALDYYTWFSDGSGRVDELEAFVGDEIDLSIRGYCYGYYNLAKDERYRNGVDNTDFDPEDLPIVLVDELGVMQQFSPAVAADEDGAFSVSFDTPGTYLLAIQGDEYTEVVSSLVKITVKPLIDINVSVSISYKGDLAIGKDNKPVAQIPLTLTGKGAYNIDDALRAVHDQCYPGGAEAGYASARGEWGLSLTKLWGDESYLFGYQVNKGDVYVGNLETEVKDGDIVDAHVYVNSWPDTESYAAFDDEYAVVEAGADYNACLKQGVFDEYFNMFMVPCEGASVYAFGIAGGPVFETDAKGIARVHFDEPGDYLLSAQKTKIVDGVEVPAITAPAMTLTVVYTPGKDALRNAIAEARNADIAAADDMEKLVFGIVYDYANGLLCSGYTDESIISSAIRNLNTAVEAAVASAQKNAEAASQVTAMIDALPQPAAATALDKKAADAAQAAYNKLTENQKNLVSEESLAKLTGVKKAADNETANGLAKGKTFTVSSAAGKFTYKVTAKKQVTLTKAASTKAKAVTINTVAFHGVTYKVTAIGANSLKSAKVTAVTVGANVKSIGATAFSNSKVSKITVKSSKLTAASKVKNALKGSKVKTVKMSGLKGATKSKTIKAFKNAGLKKVKVS